MIKLSPKRKRRTRAHRVRKYKERARFSRTRCDTAHEMVSGRYYAAFI